ncbi:trigger factor [Algoriphagus sediminis]|uniref:Trigger factor n=1 Tax=Algoriphagus sediminis TaxID=3057113 RepID=A0ABT7YH16_9BACT|nr:trigger factor [Algoriphagus sediminis]MDN3205816.1 trigger factor [Algoriphagus sediminis]
MEITLDKKSANQGLVRISLKEEDYQDKVTAKLKDYAKQANIKGFRPGKAPLGMIRNLYGTSVMVEEINSILGEKLNNYLKEQDFKILGDPIPDESKQQDIDWKTQKEFDFDYKIGFVENIEVPLDSKIKANNFKIKVDDAEVKETVENLLSQQGESSNPEVSEEGDNLYGDLAKADGTWSKTLTFPIDKLTKKLGSKFIGVSKDAVIEFPSKDVKKAQWDEAFGLTDEEKEHVDGDLTFTVKNINRTAKAELNQTFFDKIFGPDQVKNEEEFMTKVKETLQANYDKESKVYTEEELKKALVEKAKIELPEEFLKEWLLKANQGKVSAEDVEKEYPAYARQLTWSLISNHLATANDIKAEHEDVIEKTKAMVREQFAASGLGSQMEDSMDMFVDNYLKGEEGQNYMNMLTSVQNDKVLAMVMEKLKLKDKEITVEEFKKLLEE